MKKIVRLTESELINLVKRVISEEKIVIKETTTTMGGVKVTTTGEANIKIGGHLYKTKIESPVYTGPVAISSIEEVDGKFYGKNYKFTTNKGQTKTFDKDDVDNAIKNGNGKDTFSMGGNLGKIILTKIS